MKDTITFFMNIEDISQIIIVFCTVPPGEAHSIAGKLIEKALTACVNIFPIRSVYRWQGSICDEPEDLLIIKTSRDLMHELTSYLVSIHPYETPEVLCLPVVHGYDGYISWVMREVQKRHH